jgi:hypothetical protein
VTERRQEKLWVKVKEEEEEEGNFELIGIETLVGILRLVFSVFFYFIKTSFFNNELSIVALY